MGTYTTNYNLFMPTIGEQGWGELVNGNFLNIDTAMAGLNTRIGTLETETDAIAQRVGTLEGKVSDIEDISNGGDIISKSITNSESITSNKGFIGYISLPGILVNTETEGSLLYQSESGSGGVQLSENNIVNFYTTPILSRKDIKWDKYSKTYSDRVSNSVEVTLTATVNELRANTTVSHYLTFYRDGVEIKQSSKYDSLVRNWTTDLPVIIDSTPHAYSAKLTKSGYSYTKIGNISMSGFNIYIEQGTND